MNIPQIKSQSNNNVSLQPVEIVEYILRGDDKLLAALLKEQIQNLSPLPAGTIYFGVAVDDGLPVLLNIKDPVAGSVLVYGDNPFAKTALLKTIAAGASFCFSAQDIQFVVITSSGLAWTGWGNLQHCGGVFTSNGQALEDAIEALYIWMHKSACRQSLLLLIDGIDTLQNLDWAACFRIQTILMRGPFFNIWPIVVAGSIDCLSFWNECFSRYIISLPAACPSIYNSYYVLKEQSSWLKFSIFS